MNTPDARVRAGAATGRVKASPTGRRGAKSEPRRSPPRRFTWQDVLRRHWRAIQPGDRSQVLTELTLFPETAINPDSRMQLVWLGVALDRLALADTDLAWLCVVLRVQDTRQSVQAAGVKIAAFLKTLPTPRTPRGRGQLRVEN